MCTVLTMRRRYFVNTITAICLFLSLPQIQHLVFDYCIQFEFWVNYSKNIYVSSSTVLKFNIRKALDVFKRFF
jgi:hypothetical protein